MNIIETTFHSEAREKLKRGVNTLADAVKVTLGVGGKNVLIQKGLKHHITKDGVTVAESIWLEDFVENMGAQILKEAAQKTVKDAGDGTTTATVLGQAIFNLGLEAVNSGVNVIELKCGIDKAVKVVSESIVAQSKKIAVNDIEKIAIISANNDNEIGGLVTKAVKLSGETMNIRVEETENPETTIIASNGSKYERGWTSEVFCTNKAKGEVVFENGVKFLLIEAPLTNPREIEGIVGYHAEKGISLVIIADKFDQNVTEYLQTVSRAKHKVAAVIKPYFGDRATNALQDIATLTGATVVGWSSGLLLKNADPTKHFGTAEKVIITKNTIDIIGGKGSHKDIDDRCEKIRGEILEATGFEKQQKQERLAILLGKLVTINVGGGSPVEIKEKRDRIDDAVCAAKSAMAEGIVPGGGTAYIRALKFLDGLTGENESQNTGVEIVRDAIKKPLIQICQNCGIDGRVILEKVCEGIDDFGYNAKTERFEHLFASGIIDPAKVARVALENAASVAAMLLTTDCVISQK